MTSECPCPWAPSGDPLYRQYHDLEWGVPEYDDRGRVENLVLDGFQAGRSWRTILAKRDSFREAFDGFDPERIARYGEAGMNDLLGKPISREKLENAVKGWAVQHRQGPDKPV